MRTFGTISAIAIAAAVGVSFLVSGAGVRRINDPAPAPSADHFCVTGDICEASRTNIACFSVDDFNTAVDLLVQRRYADVDKLAAEAKCFFIAVGRKVRIAERRGFLSQSVKIELLNAPGIFAYTDETLRGR